MPDYNRLNFLVYTSRVKFRSTCMGLLGLLGLLTLLAWFSCFSLLRLKESFSSMPDPAPPDAVSAGVENAERLDGKADARSEVSGARTGEDAPEEQLKALRRSFSRTVREVGVPGPLRRAVEWEGYRIYTEGLPAFSPGGPGNRDVYVVQFTEAIRPDWRKELEAVGGRIFGYMPVDALAVELDARSASRLADAPHVQAVFPVQPDYKIQPFLDYLVALDADQRPDTVSLLVSVYGPDDVTAVASHVTAQGGEIVEADAGRRWGWLRVEAPVASIRDLAAFPRVQWIEEYVAPAIVNDRAVVAEHLRVTNVWATHGLTGAGQIIGHADTGLDMGNMALLHPDFTGRVVAAFARGRPGRWDDPHGHGTHTAGSIFGSGVMSTGLYRGVAWEAKLVHQSLLSSGGGLGGLPLNLADLYRQTYTNGARIHSDSWGSSVFGTYTTSARQSDEYMWDYPDMLLVFAAGNDGWDSGDGVVDLFSVGAPATAKNVLTVGASESGREPGSGGYSFFTYGNFWPWDFPAQPIRGDYISQSFDLTRQGLAAFSSRGPTDDDRIKPDVIGPGSDIVSTKSRFTGAGAGWGGHPNTNYHFNGGTSMSTPMIAGSAALVRQYLQERRRHLEPSAALIKAIIIHGARSLAPGQYGDDQFQEIPWDIPNPVEGYGQVDVETSLFPGDATWFFVDEKSGLSAPGSAKSHVFYAATGAVKVTLTYTDFPASAGAGRKLVNDLDLVLLGPDGEAAPARRDRINNSEQLSVMLPTAGLYTARVEAINVPQGPQPYVLVISGSIVDEPQVEHDPLPNTFDTTNDYRVVARVMTSATLSNDAMRLHWRNRSGAMEFAETAMTLVSNNVFEGWIPAQTNRTTVEYYLAVSAAVFRVESPADAPAEVYVFDVTESYALTVSGLPAPIFSVQPNYGTHWFASGNTVRVSAPAHVGQAPGIRLAVSGWTGGGAVPASGHALDFEITMDRTSAITWIWMTQYALTQTSSVADLLATTSWWNAWAEAASTTMPAEITHGGTNYGLSGWWLDGLRQPNATATAVNPVPSIVMYGPRLAEARYLPALQDANANLLPDWWEIFHFGTNGASPHADADGDGFTNLKEFQDRTDPRNADDYPQPPAIAHIPLGLLQTNPAPWTIQAGIVDNHAVSNASIFWRRNDAVWTSAPLSLAAAPLYTGALPAPGANGDTFVYRIEAADFAGLKAVSGPYAFSVQYASLAVAPETLGLLEWPADTSSNLTLVATNAGLAPGSLTVALHAFMDDMESGSPGWTHGGQNDIWKLTTSRYYSVRRSWHFGNGPGGLYPDSANAWLMAPEVYLHAPARLLFRHWAKMEYDDDQQDDHYWDGAVVELSVDGGETFELIHPVGGYPHRITNNPDSPFAPETPCYGKTEGWEEAEFDLAAWVGQSVRIRFRFGSDKYVRDEGWYLDDVRIEMPDPAAWTWLQVPESVVVAPGAATVIPLQTTIAPLAPGETRNAVVSIRHNDPERDGRFFIPLRLHNLTREINVSVTGEGAVDPDGMVRLLRGEDAHFWMEADPYYEIVSVTTNGGLAPIAGVSNAMFTWNAVVSNHALHVQFVERMAAGLVPEWWLASHGLTNQPFGVEALLDHDGDGMVAWQEYRADTDPLDPESVELIITGIVPGPASVALSWLSFTNTALRYEVHQAVEPGGSYLPLATNVPATPPLNTITNLEAGLQGMYFIRTVEDEP